MRGARRSPDPSGGHPAVCHDAAMVDPGGAAMPSNEDILLLTNPIVRFWLKQHRPGIVDAEGTLPLGGDDDTYRLDEPMLRVLVAYALDSLKLDDALKPFADKLTLDAQFVTDADDLLKGNVENLDAWIADYVEKKVTAA
jgi:hypothetical protein